MTRTFPYRHWIRILILLPSKLLSLFRDQAKAEVEDMCGNLACHLYGHIQWRVLSEFALHKSEICHGWHSQRKDGDSVMWLRDWYLLLRPSFLTILVKWASFWRCVHWTASRNQAVLYKLLRGHMDLVLEWVEMFSWGHLDAYSDIEQGLATTALWAKSSLLPVFLQPTYKNWFLHFYKDFKKSKKGKYFEVVKLLWNSNFSVLK